MTDQKKTKGKRQSSFGWVLSQAGPQRRRFALSVLLAVLGTCFAMLPYVIVARIVQMLVRGSMDGAFYGKACLLLALCWTLRVAFHNASTMLSHKATFLVLGMLRQKCTAKLARMPLGDVLDRPSGELKNCIVERIDSIETTLAHILPEFTANMLSPLFVFCFMLAVDWRMALASLITIPLGMAAFMGMMKDYTMNYQRTVTATKELNDTAVEYINGIEVIKVFGKTKSSYARFVDAAKEAADSYIDWMRKAANFHAVGISLTPTTLISVLPIGGLLCLSGTLSAEQFILFVILSFGLVQPLIICMSYTDDLATMGQIFGQVRSILDGREMERPPVLAGKPESMGLELKDVRFAYHDHEVLHGINLTIPAGSFTAIVGPSGSGKTTIARLIDGLWDVGEGAITLGGMDIRLIPLDQYSRWISYVSQDNFLFNLSVRENIRLGKKHASDQEVEEVARRCGCHDAIMRLEQGYDTPVGSLGSHLSGGEKQRICIARAMLKDAPIVIFDEATAYTDPENEALIQSSVMQLVKGKTLIVIAHRLSTIVQADQIAVIDGGRVVEKGTHDQLLAQGGLYKRMWEAHISVRDTDEEVLNA